MSSQDTRAGSIANGGSPEGPLPPTDEEIMLWFDGEGDAHRAAEVEAFVAKNPRARAIVAALREAASIVASDALARAGATGADSIADGVMAAIEREPSRVVPLPIRSPRARRFPLASIGVLAAAAAAALIVFFPHAKEGPLGTGETARAPSAASFSGVVVDIVDFGARAGTIFYEPSDDDSAVAVVWVTEDDTNPSSGESL
jgi:anti-sigma factor RsiW